MSQNKVITKKEWEKKKKEKWDIVALYCPKTKEWLVERKFLKRVLKVVQKAIGKALTKELCPTSKSKKK